MIDAKGRYVMPGIIDAHSHTAIEGDVNECTDSVTAEVRIADVIDHRDVDIYRQLAGGVTTIERAPRLVQHDRRAERSDQAAVGQAARRSCVFEGAPRGIKFALGENVEALELPRPRAAPRYPGTRMGVEVVLREAFLEAQAYKREWEEYERRRKAAGPKARPARPSAEGPAPGGAAATSSTARSTSTPTATARTRS